MNCFGSSVFSSLVFQTSEQLKQWDKPQRSHRAFPFSCWCLFYTLCVKEPACQQLCAVNKPSLRGCGFTFFLWYHALRWRVVFWELEMPSNNNSRQIPLVSASSRVSVGMCRRAVMVTGSCWQRISSVTGGSRATVSSLHNNSWLQEQFWKNSGCFYIFLSSPSPSCCYTNTKLYRNIRASQVTETNLQR